MREPDESIHGALLIAPSNGVALRIKEHTSVAILLLLVCSHERDKGSIMNVERLNC